MNFNTRTSTVAVRIQNTEVNRETNVINSVKAISYGIITIIILGLINQLILIMALVGYGSLAKSYPYLAPWSQTFTYLLAGLGYFIVMFFGGLATAMAAVKHSYAKTVSAAILGSSISLYVSLKDDIFTIIALFFMLLGITSAIIGCWFWRNYQRNK